MDPEDVAHEERSPEYDDVAVSCGGGTQRS